MSSFQAPKSESIECMKSEPLSVRLTEKNSHLPERVITVVEDIAVDNPGTSGRVWKYYNIAAQLALDDFAPRAHYRPRIEFLSCGSNKPDPLRPKRILELASQTLSLVAVGFAWSSSASVAALAAEELRMPYLSATAVPANVHQGAYSLSLGVAAHEAAGGVKQLLAKFEHPSLVALVALTNPQERQYLEEVQKIYDSLTVLPYEGGSFSLQELRRMLATVDRPVLFVPGYTFLSRQLRPLLEDPAYTDLKIIVGPQWSHDYKNVDLVSEHLYCVTDYYNVGHTGKHQDLSDRISDTFNVEDFDGYFHAVYDTLSFTLQALNTEEEIDRAMALQRMKNGMDCSNLSAKGFVTSRSGKIYKPLYTTKFKPGQGFELLSTISPPQV